MLGVPARAGTGGPRGVSGSCVGITVIGSAAHVRFMSEARPDLVDHVGHEERHLPTRTDRLVLHEAAAERGTLVALQTPLGGERRRHLTPPAGRGACERG
jgi:hypothetical protein